MMTNLPPVRKVTVEDYVRFKDRFLCDAEDIVVELNGGETFLPINIAAIKRFIKGTTTERIELQTNGIQPEEAYKEILPFRDRLFKIGFTYHRKMIDKVPSYRSAYERNVLMMKELGLPVYVKEILFHEEQDAILENKSKWESLGIDFKIQDFKGSFLGVSGEGIAEYTSDDWRLVSCEYIRNAGDCRCKAGYKQLLVMKDGTVISCYRMQEAVGNMIEGTYKSNYYVSLLDKKVVWI
jgi:hypothetical protein